MLKYLVRSIVFLLLCNNCFAMTFKQAQAIYTKLVIANHIRHQPTLHLRNSNEINADYNSMTGRITVNKGLLRDARNADELALVLGHELGHFVRCDIKSEPRCELGSDKLGAVFEMRAGYDVCRGALIMYRFNSPASPTHPASFLRYLKLLEQGGCR